MKTSLFLTCTILVSILFQSCSIDPSNTSTQLPVANTSAPQDYQYLLTKYVTPSGVCYNAWANNSADLAKLKNVTNHYASNTAPTDQKDALAWYLNAYNAWTLQKIFNDWPNEGPLNSSILFFHKKNIQLSGKRISLSHLENDIIRKEFNEPRIHFALNCASRSCPPLHNKAFKAATLEPTLERLTKNFINNNPHAIVEQNDEVKISKIFDWYKEDFGDDDTELLRYINQYRTKKIPLGKRIKILPYNWQLNRAE